MTTKAKYVLGGLFVFLSFISMIFPSRFEIYHTKPDFILVFIIISAVMFEKKTIIFTTLIAALTRDLIEFRYPGPYLLIYGIIVLCIYFTSSFFYRPGIIVNVLFVIFFTFLHDMLFIFSYNTYYILRFNVATNFSIMRNIANGTVYHVLWNIISGCILYYLIIFIKRRVLYEKY